MSDWQSTAREVRELLEEATRHRSERSEFVDGELAWVAHERGVMHDAANRLRARMGKAPVSAEDVYTAEMLAAGHVDYVAKYAYGIADLIHAA